MRIFQLINVFQHDLASEQLISSPSNRPQLQYDSGNLKNESKFHTGSLITSNALAQIGSTQLLDGSSFSGSRMVVRSRNTSKELSLEERVEVLDMDREESGGAITPFRRALPDVDG